MSDLIERIAALSPQKRELLLQRLNHKKENVSLEKIRPQSRESNTFPLSFAQQRLWFFEQLTPGNFTYHIVGGVRLTGTLDARSLDRSLNELVKRHEVLRTTLSEENPSSDATPDNLAYVIYTSGSTGKPKGVQVNHRSVVHLFAATHPLFNFSDRDVWTVFHSYAFDFSVWEIWGALLHGCKLIVVPLEVTQSPAAFYQMLCSERVTILNQTPSAIKLAARRSSGSKTR